jgi:hypothetical protein
MAGGAEAEDASHDDVVHSRDGRVLFASSEETSATAAAAASSESSTSPRLEDEELNAEDPEQASAASKKLERRGSLSRMKNMVEKMVLKRKESREVVERRGSVVANDATIPMLHHAASLPTAAAAAAPPPSQAGLAQRPHGLHTLRALIDAELAGQFPHRSAAEVEAALAELEPYLIRALQRLEGGAGSLPPSPKQSMTGPAHKTAKAANAPSVLLSKAPPHGTGRAVLSTTLMTINTKESQRKRVVYEYEGVPSDEQLQPLRDKVIVIHSVADPETWWQQHHHSGGSSPLVSVRLISEKSESESDGDVSSPLPPRRKASAHDEDDSDEDDDNDGDDLDGDDEDGHVQSAAKSDTRRTGSAIAARERDRRTPRGEPAGDDRPRSRSRIEREKPSYNGDGDDIVKRPAKREPEKKEIAAKKDHSNHRSVDADADVDEDEDLEDWTGKSDNQPCEAASDGGGKSNKQGGAYNAASFGKKAKQLPQSVRVRSSSMSAGRAMKIEARTALQLPAAANHRPGLHRGMRTGSMTNLNLNSAFAATAPTSSSSSPSSPAAPRPPLQSRHQPIASADSPHVPVKAAGVHTLSFASSDAEVKAKKSKKKKKKKEAKKANDKNSKEALDVESEPAKEKKKLSAKRRKEPSKEGMPAVATVTSDTHAALASAGDGSERGGAKAKVKGGSYAGASGSLSGRSKSGTRGTMTGEPRVRRVNSMSSERRQKKSLVSKKSREEDAVAVVQKEQKSASKKSDKKKAKKSDHRVVVVAEDEQENEEKEEGRGEDRSKDRSSEKRRSRAQTLDSTAYRGGVVAKEHGAV